MPVPDARQARGRLLLRAGSTPLASVDGKPVTAAQFAADVLACADALPDARCAINLCAHRYRFSVAFFAALVRGQTNLLPSQRDAAALNAVRSQHGPCVTLADDAAASADFLVEVNPGDNGAAALPVIDGASLAVVAFTSGSTGTPQPHPKSWDMLSEFRTVHSRCLAGALRAAGVPSGPLGLVATVPPWHMYGLEWTLLLPTLAPIAIHCGDAFLPRDIAAALDSFASPTVLVSTPTHIRALLRGPPPAAPVAITVSATSPLDRTLTAAAESALRTCVLEVYGCSEIGSLASRHPVHAPAWTFFDCFDLDFHDDLLTVRSPHLPAGVTLADRFAPAPNGGFDLRGRASDIVKVGGKRASLANLNAVLLATSGVEDGAIYQPESLGLPSTGRLAAVAVAPTLGARAIRAALAKQLDPAFVPRPIRLVAALPRNRASKLTMAALRSLVLENAESDEGHAHG